MSRLDLPRHSRLSFISSVRQECMVDYGYENYFQCGKRRPWQNGAAWPERAERHKVGSIEPRWQEGQELNHYRAAACRLRAARCFARFAAIRLTPSACTLTWCGFMAWRSAREARGRDKPIQTPVKRVATDGKTQPERALTKSRPRAQVVFELAKVFGQFRGPTHACAWLIWMFEGEVFCVQCLAREINARACGGPAPRTPGL